MVLVDASSGIASQDVRGLATPGLIQPSFDSRSAGGVSEMSSLLN